MIFLLSFWLKTSQGGTGSLNCIEILWRRRFLERVQMTVSSFFGCGFVAYGPILSIFFGHVGRHAYLVFLALNRYFNALTSYRASSFIWLVAILLSSGVWYLLPKNVSFLWILLISVIFQQASRVLAFYVTRVSEKRMGKHDPTLLKRLDHALGEVFFNRIDPFS